MIDTLAQDLRYALRTLAKSPGFTTVAVLTLALGIGANAGVFSLMYQVLLRPLPVPQPDRLVNLAAPGPIPGSQSCGTAGDCGALFSYPMFRDLEREQTVLTGLAAHRDLGASVSAPDAAPFTGEGLYVSGSYFPILGVRAALGRLLAPSDDRDISTGFVTVLSWDTWQTHFGADSAMVGRELRVNGQALTVVGVAPRGFEGTTLGISPLLYVPISMRGLLDPGFHGFENRRNYWIYVFGRLKPGVSLAQASADLNAVYHPIIGDVEAPLQNGMSDQTMIQFKAKRVVLTAGARGQSREHTDGRTPVLLLFAVTGIVLLIACANIGNLLLTRGAGRAMEMAVRLALGASRWRLVGQLLTESLLLAALGGAASLVVAGWTLAAVASLLPAEATGGLQFTLDAAVLGFTAAVALGTGLVFGLFPAWHSTRTAVMTAVRASAGQVSGARSAARFRDSLVTGQIALATALLAVAGLFVKSMANVSRVNLGMDVDSVVTFAISPERARYDTARTLALYDRVETALAALPGATAVTSSVVPLLAGDNWGNDVWIPGFPTGPDVDRNTRYNEVGAGYFAALGVPLLAGREFTLADRRGAPRVAVVNRAFTRKFGLARSAVGSFLSFQGPDSINVRIVGVVPDVKYSQVKDTVPPVLYLPWRQSSHVPFLHLYVRAARPQGALREIPIALKGIDPGLPVEELRTMPEQIRENVFLDRMIGLLSTAFAALATLLAAVGLYGVLAYSVAQRTREIGLRIALGADAPRVRRFVLRQVSGMLAIGGAIGIAGALGLGRAARSLLFGLTGDDPLVLALALLVLALVALGAAYVPARRATRVDPMVALRTE